MWYILLALIFGIPGRIILGAIALVLGLRLIGWVIRGILSVIMALWYALPRVVRSVISTVFFGVVIYLIIRLLVYIF